MKTKITRILAGVFIFFCIGASFGMITKSFGSIAKGDIFKADFVNDQVPITSIYEDQQFNLNKNIPLDPQSEDEFNTLDKPIKSDVKKIDLHETADVTQKDNIDCIVKLPEKPEFQGKAVKNAIALQAYPNQAFKLQLFFENTGNIPWFSSTSKCTNVPVVTLGTTRKFDRNSMFIGGGNKVEMQTSRVDPGQIGVFEFNGSTPQNADIYREYFALNGTLPKKEKTFIKDSEAMIDFHVGQPNETAESIDKKFTLIPESMPFSKLDLTAPKSMDVNLSEQKMYLKMGDNIIKVLRISSGASATPTPTGSYKIEFKQKVRIAGGGTPYIMPMWQTVHGGIGIHALPSLGNARLREKIRQLAPDEDAPVEWFKDDALWSEAVDHIGTPVSHGCMRLPPDDAKYVYGFTDIGTPITIHY